MKAALAGKAVALALPAALAPAQFTGPSARAREVTVAAIGEVLLGGYVTVTGNVVAHQRED